MHRLGRRRGLPRRRRSNSLLLHLRRRSASGAYRQGDELERRTGGAVQGRPSAAALILSRYTAAARVLYLRRGSVSFGTPYCCASHARDASARARTWDAAASRPRTATNLLRPSLPPACIILSCCADHESIVTDLQARRAGRVSGARKARGAHMHAAATQRQQRARLRLLDGAQAGKTLLRAPDKADVHAQAAVHAAALEAHEDAIGHGRPLRVARVAVHAGLREARACVSAPRGRPPRPCAARHAPPGTRLVFRAGLQLAQHLRSLAAGHGGYAAAVALRRETRAPAPVAAPRAGCGVDSSQAPRKQRRKQPERGSER